MMAQRNCPRTVLWPALDPMEGPWMVDEQAELGVGERIRELRQARRWSAQRLADEAVRAGASLLKRSAIAKVENGLRRLQFDEAVIIARIFDVPLDDLTEPELGGSSSDSVPTAGTQRSRSPQPAITPPRNDVRRAEIDWLGSALSSARGPYFWLITAPPRLGKTTLLTQLSQELDNAATRWATTLIDIREQAPETRDDSGVLLAALFGLDSPATEEQTTYRAIAQRISRQGRPVVCLVDSAELLSEDTAHRLRTSLSHVYHFVERTGNPDVRVAFIVASRLEDGWRGVAPDPRLDVLRLAELGTDEVANQLRVLAGPARSGRYSDDEFMATAATVQRMTAGLPELLQPVLDWIREEQWLDLDRLTSQEVFESLAGDYIRDWLLAPDSIFPRGNTWHQAQLDLVITAIAYLVRYRFFTQSHVRQHLAEDEDFRRQLADSDWEAEDLWAALSGMTLLTRPLAQLWQKFHPAIRRLLFRHFYPTAKQRDAAHVNASIFMTQWAAAQTGTDQVAGLVESLWHNVEALRLEGGVRVREKLRKNAGELAGALRESSSYSVSDLRSYAASRIISDVELQEAIGDYDGIADELADIVTARD